MDWSWRPYTVYGTVRSPRSTIILKRGCYITQKHLVDVPINHLMKWRDWREYPPSYDNYSYGNYRPCLLRLLQCQDFELSLPHTYTSARQLQLNNPQLNSTLWSAPRSIKPHGSHPYMAMSKTCCYFRTTDLYIKRGSINADIISWVWNFWPLPSHSQCQLSLNFIACCLSTVMSFNFTVLLPLQSPHDT